MKTQNYNFFVHEDIEKLKDLGIQCKEDDVYVMQEDRIVFVGSKEAAWSFMNANKNRGKYCKSILL